MLLWFAGLAVVGVWAVFRDPALDYRLVVAGALTPDAAHVLGVPYLHSVVAWALVLVAVMTGTRHRRTLRRRLLAIPIGGLAHLVLDATWTHAPAFWWPFLGADLVARGVPSLDRPAAVVALQEMVGVAALAWCWHRFGLRHAGPRRAFIAEGRLC